MKPYLVGVLILALDVAGALPLSTGLGWLLDNGTRFIKVDEWRSTCMEAPRA